MQPKEYGKNLARPCAAQRREFFAMFDHPMRSMQSRRIGLMHEIGSEFAARVRRILRTVDGS